jgi:hypothetical protein
MHWTEESKLGVGDRSEGSMHARTQQKERSIESREGGQDPEAWWGESSGEGTCFLVLGLAPCT